ncbi:ferritin-like domain-containing protein [Pseudomarimonas arenosa]|uniref:Ferritin-like domain-containing protein n=1 Tax=Pseudomarimonas arenosa TaxID=2774145 RepID=A0AAW3ZMX8_9GAMM|nr:ferritin-like domain-containing protein [Pseudomarimonas arenosa]MBD8527323.1 ferritin-like domain-containing protein [Pseudomarimonas arenosa]
MSELRAQAVALLAESDPELKALGSQRLYRQLCKGEIAIDPAAAPATPAAAGRPQRPPLVEPRRLTSRGLGSVEGRQAFVHAIAHIEFNAINLAWDAVQRFSGMPEQFYRDWARVADDESRHFLMLRGRLREIGADYGDFSAHNGLWEMAEKTAHSCTDRMALVPRVLEARGLDVTPGMIIKLRHLEDHVTADILQIILNEEVDHVAIGTRWYLWCCQRDGLDPEAHFFSLVSQHALAAIRSPFNDDARREAGFSEGELAWINAQAR